MLPILLALTTSIGYGTGDFLAGRLARRLAPVIIVLYIQLLQSVIVLALAWFTHQPLAWDAFAWGMGAGVVNAIALILYYQALRVGRAGVVTPIVAGGSIVPVVISIGRGTIPGVFTFIGLLAVIIGIIISTLATTNQYPEAECPSPPCRGAFRTQRTSPRLKWYPKICILLAIASALGFGVFSLLLEQGNTHANSGILWVAFGVQLGAMLITLGGTFMIVKYQDLLVHQPGMLGVLVLITMLNLGADVALVYALTPENLGIVSVFASLGPVITSMLARYFTAERLSQLQITGASLILLGTLIVAAKV